MHVAAYLTVSFIPGYRKRDRSHHAYNGASSKPSRLTTYII